MSVQTSDATTIQHYAREACESLRDFSQDLERLQYNPALASAALKANRPLRRRELRCNRYAARVQRPSHTIRSHPWNSD